MQGEVGCLKARKGPQQNPTPQRSDCRFLASRILSKQVCCWNSPCLYLLTVVYEQLGQALYDSTLMLSVLSFCAIMVDLVFRNAISFTMSIIIIIIFLP